MTSIRCAARGAIAAAFFFVAQACDDDAAYPRFRFAGTLPSEYDKSVGIDVRGSGEIANAFSALITNAYLTAAGSAFTYDLTMPDLSGLPGFPSASRLTAGTNVLTTDAYGFTGTGTFELRPAIGSEGRGSVRFTQVMVP